VTVAPASPRPPAWFIVATAVLATLLLLMAVTETSLLGHYLIDQGEFVAVVGLGFVTVAGGFLARQQRLRVSLPFVLPWLLYPVVTQGDQVIDNLSINWMRLLTHILLALIFAAPVLVLAFGARAWAATTSGGRLFTSRLLSWVPGLRQMADGQSRSGVAAFATMLLAIEFVAAHITLGLLMMGVLVVMTGIALWYGGRPERPTSPAAIGATAAVNERRLFGWLLVGVVVSGGLYVGYKNRPGAYQGSPSYLLDPSQQAAGYDLNAVPVDGGAATAGGMDVAGIQAELSLQTAALDRLVDGYYIAERNYTFDFHNHLFLRAWPVLPEYRRVALEAIAEARQMAGRAEVSPSAGAGPLASWLAEVRAYVAFNFARASVLERLTAEFERTQAGLQHAAHIYEGEGKLVGLGLRAIEDKHRATLTNPQMAPIVADYLRAAAAIHARYADRIVGF
jgi:hypothetical protein